MLDSPQQRINEIINSPKRPFHYQRRVSGVPSARTVYISNTAISRIGGVEGVEKSGCSSSKGRTSSRLNSSLVSNLTTFRRDCTNSVAGAKNLHCPVKVPHRYNVLGLYHVTDVWFETVKGKVVCRARFEMIDLKTPSWCGVKESRQPTTTPDFITKAPRETCHVCGISSKQDFEAGWTYLNETSTKFSTNDDIHQGTRA